MHATAQSLRLVLRTQPRSVSPTFR